MSEWDDIDRAVEIFRRHDCPFTLMHAVATYPMPDAQANVAAMLSLRDRYDCPVGFSSHEVGLVCSIMAAALGATALERHITLDRTMYGSDQAASLERRGLELLVRDVRLLPGHLWGWREAHDRGRSRGRGEAALFRGTLTDRSEPSSPDEGASPNEALITDGAYLDLTYSTQRAPVTEYPELLAGHLLDRCFHVPGRLLTSAVDAAISFVPSPPSGSRRWESTSLLGRARWLPDLASKWSIRRRRGRLCGLVVRRRVLEVRRGAYVLPDRSRPRGPSGLRPGGVVVVMTPSWEHQAWGPFYIDHTHVTPFTAPGLKDLLLLGGFERVTAEFFYQLPFVWRRRAARVVPRSYALPPPYRPYRERARWGEGLNKLIRFSKEVMLLAVGRKRGG